MKKLTIGILISGLLSVPLSSFFPNLSWVSKISTLYAISGIMFSIGMSIIVTSSFAKVRNKKIRERIHKSYNLVRNSYIYYFLFVSLLYIIQDGNQTYHLYKQLCFDYSIFVGLCMIFSIIFFVINFIDLQHLNRQIEEELEN